MNRLILGVAAVALVAFAAWAAYTQGADAGNYDLFAGCLTEAGFVMAGTDSCHYCQQQKEMFGGSFKFINYKNCFYDSEWCRENNITRYPTWLDPDGKAHVGKQSISRLSTLSGCDLNWQEAY